MRDFDGLRLAHDHALKGKRREEAFALFGFVHAMLTESPGDELPRRSWASSRCSRESRRSPCG